MMKVVIIFITIISAAVFNEGIPVEKSDKIIMEDGLVADGDDALEESYDTPEERKAELIEEDAGDDALDESYDTPEERNAELKEEDGGDDALDEIYDTKEEQKAELKEEDGGDDALDESYDTKEERKAELKEEDGDKMEGDIILDPYVKAMRRLQPQGDSLEKRGFLMKSAEKRKWKDGIVYYQFNYGLSPVLQDRIKKAIAHIEKNTCIRFKNQKNKNGWINIQQENGCFSSVGRTGQTPQVLGLDVGYEQRGRGWIRKTGCYMGSIVHEMVHALGFFHEQSRSDRDQYVTVKLNNVKSGPSNNPDKYKSNFERYTHVLPVQHQTAYDYNSIMHYGRKAFTKNQNLDTIVPIKSSAKIGQRDGLSPTDITEIKTFYGCNGNGNGNGNGNNNNNRINCGNPGIPSNGRRYGNQFNKGSRVSFTCNSGYRLTGSQSRTCQDKGWSGRQPTCVREFVVTMINCGDPGIPSNGRRYGNQFNKGSRVSFTCNGGYRLTGSQRRTCQDKGWSGRQPTCVSVFVVTIVNCGDPGIPSNGRRYGNQFNKGLSVIFTCNRGYRRTGSQSRTCRDKGWSGRQPTCVRRNTNAICRDKKNYCQQFRSYYCRNDPDSCKKTCGKC